MPPSGVVAHDAVTAGEQIGRQGRYGLLLATLIAVYLLSALASGRPSQAAQLVLVVAVTLIALRNTSFPHRNAARWGTVIGSVLAIAAVASSDTSVARGAASIWTGILLLATVVIIVDGVLKLDAVTAQSIYAALSAYLLIGLMFAAFFGAIDGLGGADFFVNGEPANLRTYQYFSFTTLTTLGYGDFTAGGSFGRAVAVLEALTGQVFLATLVARLVSAYRAPTRRDPPPDGASDGSAAPGGSAAPNGSAAPPKLAAVSDRSKEAGVLGCFDYRAGGICSQRPASSAGLVLRRLPCRAMPDRKRGRSPSSA
jgi:Ion channel